MRIEDANHILDTKKVLREWEGENEEKVNDFPRKITQKKYVEEKFKFDMINNTIRLLEEEIKQCSPSTESELEGVDQIIKHINEQICLKEAYGLTDKGQGYLEGLTKALLLIDDNASRLIEHKPKIHKLQKCQKEATSEKGCGEILSDIVFSKDGEQKVIRVCGENGAYCRKCFEEMNVKEAEAAPKEEKE